MAFREKDGAELSSANDLTYLTNGLMKLGEGLDQILKTAANREGECLQRIKLKSTARPNPIMSVPEILLIHCQF